MDGNDPIYKKITIIRKKFSEYNFKNEDHRISVMRNSAGEDFMPGNIALSEPVAESSVCTKEYHPV